MEIRFQYEKETKNAVRFTEISKAPVVGTLYIQKSALPALDYHPGDSIAVTIMKEDRQ